MIDTLSFMYAPLAFSLDDHLASQQSGVNPIYTLVEPGWLWLIKSAQGFPWDGNAFDEAFVYQNYTETPQGWTDPSSYKKFVSKSTPNGGILWAPRQLPGDGIPVVLSTEDSSYQTWQNGRLVSTQSLETVRTVTSGPQTMKIGAFQSLAVLTVQYLWGAVMEVSYYGFGYGLVRWDQYDLSAGSPALKTSNVFDQVTPGGSPVLVRPKN